MPYRTSQNGFSLLELVIVIILISLLVVIAIDRLLILSVEAERVSVAKIAGELRSAMGIQVAKTIVEDKNLQNIGKLHKSNPMDMLAETPGTYIGAFETPQLQAIKGGSWFFDQGNGELVYVVINDGYLKTDLAGRKRIRFQIQLLYEDKNGNKKFDAGVDSAHGMRLKELDKYEWLLEEDITTFVEN